MTIIKALSKEINERIARQCILALLDDDGSSMRAWLEEEFGDYPDYKLRPDRWVCRFIREATNGHAKLTFDPDRNQAQIMVGKGGHEGLIAYQDITGPLGDLLKMENRRLGDASAAEMIAMIQKQAGHRPPEG
jgi:hypothetical protein